MGILGISGTFASGKDTVAKYLEERHEFVHVSTGDMIRREAANQGLADEREVLVELGNELRSKYGSGVLVERAISFHESVNNLVVSGIRVVGEAQALRNAQGKLIFLDAPIKTRYGRLRSRGRIGDETTLEQFIAHEKLEMSSKEATHQNILGVRQLADFEIINDKGQDELFFTVRALLAQL